MRERFIGELQLVSVHALDFCADGRALDAEFVSAFFEQAIKRRARGILSISGHGRAGEGGEREIDLFVLAQREADAGLVLANGGDAFLQVQFAQDGDDGGNEGFADDQVRAASIVKNGYIQAFFYQERGEGGTRRAAANDPNGFNGIIAHCRKSLSWHKDDFAKALSARKKFIVTSSEEARVKKFHKHLTFFND
jgi:hypothetical protein